MVSISVVLPNRNHAHFLPRALAALAAQTRPADEVILIDDASSDDSVAVARSWQDRLPGLRILPQTEHRGVVGVLNLGLAEARGDLIYAAAADDAARPRLFERAAAAFAAHPAAGVFCAEVLVIDDDGTGRAIRPAAAPLRGHHFTPAAFRKWLEGSDNLCVGVASLARREAMLALGGYDPSLGPFCDSFLLRRVGLTHGVIFHPEVLGEWHRSMHGISRSLARDADLTLAYIAEARRRIEEDRSGLYPPGYGEAFARRAAFNAARIALPDTQLAARLAGVPEARLARLARLPRFGRLAAMAALTLSLRPMSLTRLVRAQVWQRLRGLADPGRLKVQEERD